MIEFKTEDPEPKTLSVYLNCQNCPSTHVVLWVHEDPHGHPGASAAIRLPPYQTLELAALLEDLAEQILNPDQEEA